MNQRSSVYFLFSLRVQARGINRHKKGHHGTRGGLRRRAGIIYSPFFRVGAGLNPTVRLALIEITAPVWGFLPLRALRERTVNVPKPGT